jgi:hypothetical protein
MLKISFLAMKANKGSAKVLTDAEVGLLNSLEQYDLELLCLRSISMLFSEVSSALRASHRLS